MPTRSNGGHSGYASGRPEGALTLRPGRGSQERGAGMRRVTAHACCLEPHGHLPHNWVVDWTRMLNWARLSCIRFGADAMRLQLHALAYNLASLDRTLAMPKAVETWSLICANFLSRPAPAWIGTATTLCSRWPSNAVTSTDRDRKRADGAPKRRTGGVKRPNAFPLHQDRAGDLLLPPPLWRRRGHVRMFVGNGG